MRRPRLVEEGRWREAEGLFLKALESITAAHPDRLVCTNGLAEVLHKRGRLQEAEALYRQMQGGAGRLEEPAPEILRVFSGLADVLLDLGRFPEAEALHRRVLEARHAAFGEEHPETLQSNGRLAEAWRQAGRLREAEAVFREALWRRRGKLGESHVDTLRGMCDLAKVLHDLGELEEAHQLLQKALSARRRSWAKTTWTPWQPSTVSPQGNVTEATWKWPNRCSSSR